MRAKQICKKISFKGQQSKTNQYMKIRQNKQNSQCVYELFTRYDFTYLQKENQQKL
jgi:hypothetical protein